MDDASPPPFAAALLRRAADGGPPERIADDILSVLREVDQALEPVVGPRGVGALLGRSLHLAGRRHAFLIAVSDGREAALDPVRLKETLVAQRAEEAAAAGAELLAALHGLLAGLVGEALTARLLGEVWSRLLGDAPAQEPLP